VGDAPQQFVKVFGVGGLGGRKTFQPLARFLQRAGEVFRRSQGWLHRWDSFPLGWAACYAFIYTPAGRVAARPTSRIRERASAVAARRDFPSPLKGTLLDCRPHPAA